MTHYKKGLFIGRFQPFHRGHLYSIREALKKIEQLVIAVGSAQSARTEENPFSASERLEAIKLLIAAEKLQSRISLIITSYDNPSDDIWLAQLIKQGGIFEVVVGNNERVNTIFRKNKFAVIETGLYERDLLEGIKIRNLINNQKKWENRVPDYLVDYYKEIIDTMAALTTVLFQIRGSVIGVGYRFFVQDCATELGLHGWVKNSDDHVEALIQGPKNKVELFAEKLKTGPGRVTKIIQTAQQKSKQFQSFQILLT